MHTTWLYTLSSFVFFIGFYDVFVALILLEGYVPAPGALMASLVVLQLVCAGLQIRYCWFLRVGRGGGLPHPAWTVAVLVPAAAVYVLGLFAPGGGFVAAAALWASACLIACLVPRRTGWLVLGASAALVVAHLLIAQRIGGIAANAFELGSGGWPVLVYSALLPAMLFSSLWWWQIVVQLDRNRRIAAELAVTQERLRFASDLHDIQGHHLQVISLKAELAERLLDRDPQAARDNIHEVRLIAKEALEGTRSLVAGYRQVALDDELENAREVLTAAGADCTLELADLPTDAAARSALGSVVREATTNILRHSSAAHVRIALRVEGDRCVLEIENDGVTDAAADPPGTGSGIAGLRDRLDAIGGTIETATDASGSQFTLRAEVPLRVEAGA